MMTERAQSVATQRILVMLIFACIGGMICIGALFALRQGYLPSRSAKMIFGLEVGDAYPLSIQSLSWLVFFIGCGELLFRWLHVRAEERLLRSALLPPGHGGVYRKQDLGPLFVAAKSAGDHRLLSRAIMRVVSSFQISNSASQGGAVLQTTMDLFSHEADLRYNLTRYILWLLPSLGFIGTVWGIGQGLHSISENPPTIETAQTVLTEVTGDLSIAFDTTLVALLLTTVLAYFFHVIQTSDERVVNSVGQRCVDDLVNQLLED